MKTKSTIFIAIFLAIIIVLLGYIFLLEPQSIKINKDDSNLDLSKNISSINSIPDLKEISTFSDSPDITCYQNSKYFIVSKLLKTGPGSDILIKYKDSNPNISCIYQVHSTDFEIKDNGESYYFLSLQDDFLILDSGTSASIRGITVFNLNNRQKILSDSYLLVEQPVINNNSISYWTSTNKIATKDNCSNFEQYLKIGNPIVIRAQVIFDLKNLTKQETGNYRCHITE